MSNNEEPRIVRDEIPVAPRPVIEAQPLGARSVVEPHVVVEHPAAPVVVAPATAVRTTSYRRFAPDAVIAAAVGLVVMIVGLLAVVRGGFDGPMEDPVVEVLGFTHTTTLGLIEVVLGGLLLICGVSAWRSGALFFGSIMAIGGFIGAVQTESFAADPRARVRARLARHARRHRRRGLGVADPPLRQPQHRRPGVLTEVGHLKRSVPTRAFR